MVLHNDPKKVSDFCPVSPCNVSYKVISKAFADRLKEWLPPILLLDQMHLVLGSLTTNNTLDFEVIYLNKRKIGGKEGLMGLIKKWNRTIAVAISSYFDYFYLLVCFKRHH